MPDRPGSSRLRAKTTTDFDDQGLPYQSKVYSVTYSGTIGGALASRVWFDRTGLPVKTSAPGGLVRKFAYDAAGRLTAEYATDGGGDATWDDARGLTGDNVYEQTDFGYNRSGYVNQTTNRQRFHSATGTGALGTSTSGVLARVSYTTAYYDAANRLADAVDYGTFGGLSWTRPTSPPSASSATELRTHYDYNASGWVSLVTDPREVKTSIGYDALGRRIRVIEAYTDGKVSPQDDRTTEFEYDGLDRMIKYKAYFGQSVEDYQLTQYVYGVTTADGSKINSNDLLRVTIHPAIDPGQAGPLQQDLSSYDALGTAIKITDRRGVVHEYAFDVLGRPLTDKVTSLGGSLIVDGSVRRLETAYDSAGRPWKFTSYTSSDGTVVYNQVERTYNGLGQLTKEAQATIGSVAVNTPSVQYGYSEMAGGANHSRPTTLTYPDGRVVAYGYAAGFRSDAISRVSSMTDGANIENYAYLGLGTVVARTYGSNTLRQNYVALAGETGDGGDQYTGLDRFGRVVRRRWLNAASQPVEDLSYGYDQGGNRMWRENKLAPTFSELYHANGASQGYDALGQLQAYARGTLNTAKDTIASPVRSQGWTIDAMGNFSQVVTTNGGSSTTDTRTHDGQNRLTQITGTSGQVAAHL